MARTEGTSGSIIEVMKPQVKNSVVTVTKEARWSPDRSFMLTLYASAASASCARASEPSGPASSPSCGGRIYSSMRSPSCGAPM